MATLEKRIESLESFAGDENDREIFVAFIAPLSASTPLEISNIRTDTQEWQRRPDESEQDFKARARREVAQPARRNLAVLFCQ